MPPIKSLINNSWFWPGFWFTCGATAMAWGSYFVGRFKPELNLLTQSRKEGDEIQKQNPFDALAQECKISDATHIKLTRKPEIFMWVWVYYLDKLRKERNTHDTNNIFNVIGSYIHAPGNGNASVGMDEVLYTIKCLASRGYITLEKSDHGHCSYYDNNNIKFNAKYDELIKWVTFHDDGGKLTMSWR